MTDIIAESTGHELVVEINGAQIVIGTAVAGGAGGGSGTDDDAIHDNVAGEIVAVAEKLSPAGADVLLIEDSADSNNKKRVSITNLPGGGGAPWVKDEFTPTNGQVSFILSATPTDLASFELTVNGVEYDDVVDYTVSGTTVTWLDPFTLKTKDKLIIQYK